TLSTTVLTLYSIFFLSLPPPPPTPTLFPYTTLFRSDAGRLRPERAKSCVPAGACADECGCPRGSARPAGMASRHLPLPAGHPRRSEEHTSELQSRFDLVCRLLLEKKKINNIISIQIL